MKGERTTQQMSQRGVSQSVCLLLSTNSQAPAVIVTDDFYQIKSEKQRQLEKSRGGAMFSRSFSASKGWRDDFGKLQAPARRNSGVARCF